VRHIPRFAIEKTINEPCFSLQFFAVLLLATVAVAKPLDEVTTISSLEGLDSSTPAPVNILNGEQEATVEQINAGNTAEIQQQQQEAISGRNFGSVTVLGEQVS